MKKSILALSVALLLAFSLAGCGASGASAPDSSEKTEASSAAASQASSEPASTTGETTKIVVGATPAPHAEILEFIAPKLAEQGITLEIKEFNDYIVPNTALEDGSLDANYFQHLPYLENFNKENGTHLVSAAGIHIEPLGIYPGRIKSLEELPDGATVGIPNDPTNEARALALLQVAGLIKLNEDAGLDAVPSDIAENTKNLKFMELEAAQLPATLPDLDLAVINGNYAVEAGLGGTALATEGAESPYVNVIAVREGDETRPEIVALVNALQTEEVRKFMDERYGGVVVPVF